MAYVFYILKYLNGCFNLKSDNNLLSPYNESSLKFILFFNLILCHRYTSEPATIWRYEIIGWHA